MASFGWKDEDVAKMLADKGRSVPPAPPKPRHDIPEAQDGMNKLEARYVREVLDLRRLAGEIVSWKFEAVKFRLAKATFYTPDFLVVLPGGLIQVHETKGHWEDDARVKIKVAAEMFREFRFIAVQRKKGIWIYEMFTP